MTWEQRGGSLQVYWEELRLWDHIAGLWTLSRAWFFYKMFSGNPMTAILSPHPLSAPQLSCPWLLLAWRGGGKHRLQGRLGVSHVLPMRDPGLAFPTCKLGVRIPARGSPRSKAQYKHPGGEPPPPSHLGKARAESRSLRSMQPTILPEISQRSPRWRLSPNKEVL